MTHYNAFISYRHAPQDIKVAAEIQKRLEQFKVPAAIRKSTGMKKIDRIFRDKEELPITSDLNTTIENALVHSDYLIVICSHNTKESIWVQREIEFFLKTHSRRQILTVLVDGEPGEVIPEILQYEETTVTLESGESQVVQVPIEPLSCDYRGDFRKARREELPRLAAALLGCSYDDLKRRQRQYRMRRITVAVSAVMVCMVALSVYFAWSANQIRSNYEQSLINQSKYLSNEALTLFEEGDRVSAMLLALEALPKDSNDDRPVIPQAEYALSQALGAYVHPHNQTMRVENSYTHGGVISDYLLSYDQDLLFVSHSDNIVTVWQADSYEQLQELTLPTTVHQIGTTADNNLLVLCTQQLYCYQPETGEELWCTSLDTYKDTTGYTFTFAVSPCGSTLACSAGEYLVIVDTTSGQVLQDTLLPTYKSDYSDAIYPYEIDWIEYTSDGEHLTMVLGSTGEYAALCNLNDMQISLFEEAYDDINHILYTDDALLITGIWDIYAGWGNSRLEDTYIYSDSYSTITCFNTDGSLRWQQKLEYVQFAVGYEYSLQYYDYLSQEGERIPSVVTTAGEKMGIVDLATGDTLAYVEYPSVIVNLLIADGFFSSVHLDGSWFNYMPDTGELLSTFCYVKDSDSVLELEDTSYVVLQDEGTILRYVFDLHDPNWKTLSSEKSFDDYLALLGFTYSKTQGSRTVLYNSYNFSKPFIVIFGDEDRYGVYPALAEEYTANYPYFIGFDDSGDKLLFTYNTDDQDSVAAFDLTTGLFDPNYLPMRYIFNGTSDDTFYMSDSLILYEGYGSADHPLDFSYICLYPDGTEKSIPSPIGFFTYFIYVNEQETFALAVNYKNEFCVLNLQDQTLIEGLSFADEATAPLVSWTSCEDQFVIATQNQIRLYDTSLTELLSIPCKGMTPQAIYCHDQILYVIYSGSEMYSYSLADGSFISKINIDLPSNIHNVQWTILPNGDLSVLTSQKLNIIDTKENTLKTNVDHCLSYHAEDQKIYVGTHDADRNLLLGYFDLYTYEELIAMAKEQLGTTVLTPQQRSQYGIN